MTQKNNNNNCLILKIKNIIQNIELRIFRYIPMMLEYFHLYSNFDMNLSLYENTLIQNANRTL